MKQIFSLLFFILCLIQLSAQNHNARFENIDVQHYIFEIHLNDSTNIIEGKTTVKVKLLKQAEKLTLDLIGKNDSTNTGMIVSNVKFKDNPVRYTHKNGQLVIDFNTLIISGKTVELEIMYSGIPADGLIISKNKYAERTFFGDNWPDRAKHWLPTVDHPSDKATLEFLVYAPEHYEVVSNGYLVSKKPLKNKMELTHWKEDIAISTKIMVIGVADFAVGNKTTYNKIPVSSWVFEQNKEKGFENYKYGTKALEYFSDLIGPYSYEKLAHVQSKTRYGGMENATCIFYHENTGTSNRSQERLFAHEVAHQWFGNSVTEQNWHHVWLSEGFATYLTHIYKQHFYGEEIFRSGLLNDREKVIKYTNKKLAPVIDTTVTQYINLLNTNSYQKASWFLHMLRENLGDEVFFKGLRKYYADFRNSTALTKDFQDVMGSVSGKDLDLFFYQWLYQPGFPKLKVEWKQKSNKNLVLDISQVQENYIVSFPFEIEIRLKNGDKVLQTVEIKNRKSKITIPLKEKVESVFLDPEVKLLFEEVR